MKPVSELPAHWQEWYRGWDAGVLENEHKLRLRGALLGEPGSQQSYSAAFELFLFSMFKKLGLNVDFQPKVKGVNPDFYISDKRGWGAYIEAGVIFNDPIEIEMLYLSKAMPIWDEFRKLQSQDFSVYLASSSGNPGNVSPQSVRRAVQLWIDQLDATQVLIQHHYGIIPERSFQFKDWTLDVMLQLKSSKDKVRLGTKAVDLAGFSGGWSDNPGRRLKSKIGDKFSQARRTGSPCIVAITERLGSPSTDSLQVALFGGNSESILRFGQEIDDSYPYLKGVTIPRPNPGGLWSSHDAKEPVAALVHIGNLQFPNIGETEMWLNPNGSYFDIPLPLFALKVHSVVQNVWTKATANPYA